MVLGFLNGQMVENIKEIGKMVNSLEKVFLVKNVLVNKKNLTIFNLERVYGKMEN